MVLSSLPEARAELSRLIDNAARVTIFTGAGLSTECGVPDFRSPNSPWMKFKPIDFDMFVSDPLMREEAWRRKFAMDDLYAHAKPGRGPSRARLARGEREGGRHHHPEHRQSASGVGRPAGRK